MVWLRLICAVLLAWAINLVLGRPVAAPLIGEVPEMFYIGPSVGAAIGFLMILARRGSGVIVATLNGAWSGFLVIALSGFVYLVIRLLDSIIHGLIEDFEAFLRVLAYEAKPLIETGIDLKLIGVTVGATALVGLMSELLNWCRVRIRRHRGLPEEKEQVRAAVARAGAHI